MIEELSGFPDNVVAMVARGRVSRSDYERVLIPRVSQALGRHARIRCYYELATDAGFDAGAVWEDFKIGLEHLSRWERVAVVTDIDWIRMAANVFRFLVPGEVRIFPADQATQARGWIGET